MGGLMAWLACNDVVGVLTLSGLSMILDATSVLAVSSRPSGRSSCPYHEVV